MVHVSQLSREDPTAHKLQRPLRAHQRTGRIALYLGWMTTFDEAARIAIYSDTQLDLLATTAADMPNPSEADPGHILLSKSLRERRPP